MVDQEVTATSAPDASTTVGVRERAARSDAQDPRANRARRWWHLDFGGLIGGLILAAVAMTPSLMPRTDLAQGIVSGVAFLAGYSVGAACSSVIARLRPWSPSRRARVVLRSIAGVILGGLLIAFAAASLHWQNDVRRAVEVPVVDAFDVVLFLAGFVPVVIVGIAIGRGIRRLFRVLARRLGRGWGAAVTVVGLLAVTIGALALAFLALDRVYLATNGQVADGVVEPDSGFRSAGPESEVRWDQVGRHGSSFLAGGPTADDIRAMTGAAAVEPVRVYVGVANAPTVEERAAMAVRELERTGGFDREVLVVATTTGSGWLEPQAVDAVEYLHGGDTAIAAIQFSHQPSFVSFLLDPDAPVASSRELYRAVHERWISLPPSDRPGLYLYGLSLGAHGAQATFSDLSALRAGTSGALFAGSPNHSAMWRELTARRDVGSPAWKPVVDDGREVRWLSEHGDFDAIEGRWDEPRVAYLQHGTDPVTWLGPELIWASPEWLEPGQRAPDVSDSMVWIPLVTAVQLVIDKFASDHVPASHGHNYGDVYVDGWRSVSGDADLPQDAIDRIQARIEAYAPTQPTGRYLE
ncbi:alpha/beta-hydrolase family protein [Agromyces sp. G08B096]|uniref:Alpha/beta-hydrolase family protein n=1 Tax=Agromyces sp. G08B096 TaxID=3156399 RepID=A0AAU7W7X0_9MICO